MEGWEGEEYQVEEQVTGEVDGGDYCEGETTLEKMIYVVEDGSGYLRRHKGHTQQCPWRGKRKSSWW